VSCLLSASRRTSPPGHGCRLSFEGDRCGEWRLAWQTSINYTVLAAACVPVYPLYGNSRKSACVRRCGAGCCSLVSAVCVCDSQKLCILSFDVCRQKKNPNMRQLPICFVFLFCVYSKCPASSYVIGHISDVRALVRQHSHDARARHLPPVGLLARTERYASIKT
jgi:hypothetical protein